MVSVSIYKGQNRLREGQRCPGSRREWQSGDSNLWFQSRVLNLALNEAHLPLLFGFAEL